MDRATLIAAMGNDVISDDEVAAFNTALVAANCTTVKRAAMFAAQTGHECVGMRTYEEYASGSAYEWRKDLGNVQAGDGVRYKGRGIIQLTGRANYGSFSRWAHGEGLVSSPNYFVDNPTKVGELPWAFIAASYYWTVARDMNSFADRGDIEGATRAVNGGLNGFQDRIARYNRCLALGEALLPSEEISVAAKDDIIKFIEAYVGPIISDVKDIRQQLTGGRDKGQFPGWAQLGQNSSGQNLTVVDSLADVRARVIELEKKLGKSE